MKKELIYLQISGPKHKGDFLQHIHELIHIPLSAGDTYNILFSKLRCHFKDNAALPFVEEWIQFNFEEQDDKSVFDHILVDTDGNYALFNLANIK